MPGSLKSPLKSSASSCARALLAMTMCKPDQQEGSSPPIPTANIQLTFESLFDIHGLLGTGFKVRDIVFGRAECHGSFR